MPDENPTPDEPARDFGNVDPDRDHDRDHDPRTAVPVTTTATTTTTATATPTTTTTASLRCGGQLVVPGDDVHDCAEIDAHAVAKHLHFV